MWFLTRPTNNGHPTSCVVQSYSLVWSTKDLTKLLPVPWMSPHNKQIKITLRWYDIFGFQKLQIQKNLSLTLKPLVLIAMPPKSVGETDEHLQHSLASALNSDKYQLRPPYPPQ